MIDYHCHILPGLDDGPKDIDESVAMAAVLYKAGFKTIYCTPHAMKGLHDTDNQAVLSTVITLQKRLIAENIKVEILPGREYYLDEFLGHYLKHPLPLGKTNYIMIEIPNYSSERYVKEVCFRIKCSGFIPMIAHPERSMLFALNQKRKTSLFDFTGSKSKISEATEKKTALINYLKDIGCAFQGNIGSFDGMYGPEVRQTAKALKTKKVFTHFGTDAHSLQSIMRMNLSSASGSVFSLVC
jgi:protein-tyrosine phosphatase